MVVFLKKKHQVQFVITWRPVNSLAAGIGAGPASAGQPLLTGDDGLLGPDSPFDVLMHELCQKVAMSLDSVWQKK